MAAVIKSLLTFFVLMIVCSNIAGFITNGLFAKRILERRKDELKEMADTVNEAEAQALLRNLANSVSLSRILGIFAFIISVPGLVIIYYWLSPQAAVAGLLLILAALPDKKHEVETGARISKANMPKRPVNILATLIIWLCLPLVFWGFLGR